MLKQKNDSSGCSSFLGLFLILVTALGFYGTVYAIAIATFDHVRESQFYRPTCMMLIESGWDVTQADCMGRFREAAP